MDQNKIHAEIYKNSMKAMKKEMNFV